AALGVCRSADRARICCGSIYKRWDDYLIGNVVACRGAALDFVDQVVEHIHTLRPVRGEQARGAFAWAGRPPPCACQGLRVKPFPTALFEIDAMHLFQQSTRDRGYIACAA